MKATRSGNVGFFGLNAVLVLPSILMLISSPGIQGRFLNNRLVSSDPDWEISELLRDLASKPDFFLHFQQESDLEPKNQGPKTKPDLPPTTEAQNHNSDEKAKVSLIDGADATENEIPDMSKFFKALGGPTGEEATTIEVLVPEIMISDKEAAEPINIAGKTSLSSQLPPPGIASQIEILIVEEAQTKAPSDEITSSSQRVDPSSPSAGQKRKVEKDNDLAPPVKILGPILPLPTSAPLALPFFEEASAAGFLPSAEVPYDPLRGKNPIDILLEPLEAIINMADTRPSEESILPSPTTPSSKPEHKSRTASEFEYRPESDRKEYTKARHGKKENEPEDIFMSWTSDQEPLPKMETSSMSMTFDMPMDAPGPSQVHHRRDPLKYRNDNWGRISKTIQDKMGEHKGKLPRPSREHHRDQSQGRTSRPVTEGQPMDLFDILGFAENEDRTDRNRDSDRFGDVVTEPGRDCSQVTCKPPPSDANCVLESAAIRISKTSKFQKFQDCCPIWFCEYPLDGFFFAHYGMKSLRGSGLGGNGAPHNRLNHGRSHASPKYHESSRGKRPHLDMYELEPLAITSEVGRMSENAPELDLQLNALNRRQQKMEPTFNRDVKLNRQSHQKNKNEAKVQTSNQDTSSEPPFFPLNSGSVPNIFEHLFPVPPPTPPFAQNTHHSGEQSKRVTKSRSHTILNDHADVMNSFQSTLNSFTLPPMIDPGMPHHRNRNPHQRQSSNPGLPFPFPPSFSSPFPLPPFFPGFSSPGYEPTTMPRKPKRKGQRMEVTQEPILFFPFGESIDFPFGPAFDPPANRDMKPFSSSMPQKHAGKSQRRESHSMAGTIRNDFDLNDLLEESQGDWDQVILDFPLGFEDRA